MPEIEKLSTADFAAKIKAKYPEYKDVDDNTLTEKMIAKYPEYKDKVDYTPSGTIEKKNPVQSARPLPNGGENVTVSSTETVSPSTVSASESVQRTAPTPLASTRMPQAPTSDPNLIARQQEQQIVEQQRNQVTPMQSAFNEVPTNIPVVPTRQQPTVDLKPMPTETFVKGGETFEFQRNIADQTPKKDQNYLSLGKEEKPLADNLLKGVYTDVISKRPDKDNVSEEEITEYIFANTPNTGNPEVDIKVRNAALEQVLGNKAIGDNRFDEMRSNYKKEERSNVLNTYVKKEYGDMADALVEELGIKRGISDSQENINNSTVSLSGNALKALYDNGQYRFTISQSESDIAPNLAKKTQDGSSGLVVDYASSKTPNVQQGQQVADLTFEQVKELYKKGALTFPNPLSDPMFNAYVNESAPKVERVKTDELKNKAIQSFTGKPVDRATPQENVAGFLKVVKDVDDNIQKLDVFDTDTKIIKKSYDRLIDINNKVKDIDSQISALESREMTSEKRQQISILKTQKDIYQEKVNQMQGEIEGRKQNVLGYSTKLFDPLTGKPIDPSLEQNPSVAKWNEDLNAKTDKYLKGYQGSLEEAKVDSYNKFKYYQDLILSQDRFKDYHGDVKNGGVPYPFFESSDNLLNAYQDAAAELTAISRVEALNLDIQDMPRYKGAAFVNGLLDASIGGKSYKTSTEFTQDFVKAAQENGIELTDAQKDRAKETFGEKAAYATGASLPVMVQIVATTLATEGLGLGAAIGEAATLVKGMKAVKDSKSLVKAVDILEDAVKTGFVFDVSGESFATGVGESLGEQLGSGLTNAIDLSKFFGSTKAGKVFGTILNATAKRASGATGEVIAEYVGEFVDELSKNDLTSAIANTIGDDPLEKLALTYMVSGIYSSASSVGDIGKFRENIKEAIKSDPRPDSELPPIVQEVKAAILEQEKAETEIEKKVSETAPMGGETTVETTTETETEPTKPNINPIIENIEGADTAYTDSEGNFFSKGEVISMIENVDEKVNGILFTNPSPEVVAALEKAKEVAPEMGTTETVTEMGTEETPIVAETAETVGSTPVNQEVTETTPQATQAGETNTTQNEVQQTETQTESTPETVQVEAGKPELEKESELPTKVTEKAKKQGLMTSTGQTNSYMLKKLQRVQPTTARQAILRAFVGGTKILQSDMTRETGFGSVSGLDGKIRGKEEAENKKYITTTDTKAGKTVDDLVLMVAETLEANGIPVNETEIRNEIITVLSDFNTRQEMASELFEDFSLEGVLFETMEEKLEASAIAYYSDSSNFEPEFTKEEIASFEQEEEFNQYINNLSDAEIEQIYGRYEPTGEATKSTEGGKSKTVATKTEVTKPKEVEKPKANLLADKLRERAAKLRGTGGGTLTALPNAVAASMEALATILDKVGDIQAGIAKWRKSEAYKNLSKEEKSEVDTIANELVSEVEVDEVIEPIEKAKSESEGKERRLPKSIDKNPDISDEIKQGLSEDARKYIPISNEVTTEEAKAIIKAKGTDKAMSDVLDFNNPMTIRTRVEIARQLIVDFNKTDPDSAIKIAEEMSKYATQLGQGVQALSLWSGVSPESIVAGVNKKAKKAKQESKKRNKSTYDGVKKGYKQGTETAAKKATKEVVDSQPPSKKREIKAFGLSESQIDKKLESALDKFKKAGQSSASSSIIGLNNEQIEALVEIGYLYFAKGLRNFKDWASKISEDTGLEDMNALQSIWDNEKVNNGKTLKQLSEVGQLEDVVSKSYSEGKSVDELSEIIQETFGVNKDFADSLSKEIDKSFKKIVGKERKKAIRNNVPSNKKTRKIVDEISEQNDLTDEQIEDAIAKEFGIEEFPESKKKELFDMAEKRDALPEGYLRNRATSQMLAFIDAESKVPFKDKFWGLWYASVLSGHETQILNAAANWINLTMEGMVSSIQQALINRDPTAIAKVMSGFVSGLKQGLTEAGQVLTTGDSPRKMKEKYEIREGLEKVTFKGGKFNPTNYAKYVGRFMSAIDAASNLTGRGMMLQEVARETAISEGLKTEAEIVKRVSEILNNSDEVFESATQQAKEEVDAFIDGSTEKISEREKNRLYDIRRDEIIESAIPDEVSIPAKRFGDFVTFNYQTQGVIGILAEALNRLSSKIPGGAFKLIVPFTGVVANVLNQMIDYTPYGYLRSMGLNFGNAASQAMFDNGYESTSPLQGNTVFGTGLKNAVSEKQNQRQLIKATMGTALMVGVYLLAKAYEDDEDPFFEISSGGPSDPAKKSQLYAQGWKPYSLKIGGTRISYQYTPMGLALGFVGNWLEGEKYKELDQKDLATKSVFALKSSAKGVLDMSFLTGLSGLMSSLSSTNDPEKEANKFLNSISRTATSFIPNALKQMDKVFHDNTIYETKTLQASILADIPFVKSYVGLKPKLNALGQDIERQGNRFFTNVTDDVVWKFLADKDIFIEGISSTRKMPNGEVITTEELYDVVKISGLRSHEKIKEMIPEFKRKGLTNDEIKEKINKIIDKDREKAIKEVYKKNKSTNN